jgi:hypothetical protein
MIVNQGCDETRRPGKCFPCGFGIQHDEGIRSEDMWWRRRQEDGEKRW